MNRLTLHIEFILALSPAHQAISFAYPFLLYSGGAGNANSHWWSSMCFLFVDTKLNDISAYFRELEGVALSIFLVELIDLN